MNRSSHPASVPKTMEIRAHLLLLSMVLKRTSVESEEQTSFFAAAPASDDMNPEPPAQGRLLDLSPLGRDLPVFSLQSSHQAERRERVETMLAARESEAAATKARKSARDVISRSRHAALANTVATAKTTAAAAGKKEANRTERPPRQVPTRKGEPYSTRSKVTQIFPKMPAKSPIRR